MRIDSKGLIASTIIWMQAPAVLAADLAYGEYLAGECVACHRKGADAAIPRIDALPAARFIKALNEYRDGRRDHDLMRTVARSLGQAEMEALAAYFEQLDDE